MNGLLIVIMGIDGAGKTTLIQNIKKCSINISGLKSMSIFDESIFTKELEETADKQGKTRREMFSPRLRSIIWRNDLINNTLTKVVPELEKGHIVILDRYCLCNKVYSNLEKEGLSHMDKILDILPKPDLGIFLDVNESVAVERIKKRGKEIAPYETIQKLKELRTRYLQKLPEEQYPIFSINANLSEKEVTEQTIKCIVQILNKKMQKRNEKNGNERSI